MTSKEAKGWNPVWEEIFQTRSWSKYPEIELVRFIARNYYKVPNRKDIKILDLGCGTGAHSWFLAREGFDVYSIDASETAIKKLKERFDEEGLKHKTFLGDIINLPFEDDLFNAVVELECMSCNTVNNIKKIIDETHRVLKDSGKFYSQFFGRRTLGHGTGRKIEEGTYTDLTKGTLTGLGTIHFTEEKEIKSFFSKFKDIFIERVDRTMNNQKDIVEEYIIIATK